MRTRLKTPVSIKNTKVNQRRARSVLGWVTIQGKERVVTCVGLYLPNIIDLEKVA